jgi:hypothetical protein
MMLEALPALSPGISEGGVLWNSLAHSEPVPAPLS